MTHENWYHGGLVYLGATEGAIERFCRIVATTLQDYGHLVDRQSVLNIEQARIVTSQYIVKLSVETAPYAGRIVAPERMGKQPSKPMHRLEFSLMPVAPGEEDRDITELLMVVMLYRMVDAYPVQQIEWMAPETILSVEQFLGAFANVTPRRVHSRAHFQGPKSNRFAPVDEMEADLSQQAEIIESDIVFDDHQIGVALIGEEESLALAFRDDMADMITPVTPEQKAETDIRRLTTWGMTGMLVFLSGPVALSMAAINLVKGEDFRLNTHVLALTAFVASTSGSGLLANAMSYLPI